MFSGKAEMGRDFYVKIVNADKQVGYFYVKIVNADNQVDLISTSSSF